MATDLFRSNLARFRASCAREAGCDVADFDSHALTVAARPEASREKGPATVFTFGTGTVVSVAPGYLDWARSIVVKKHYLVFSPSDFHAPLLAEVERRGEKASARGASLGFIPDVVPSEPTLPAGLRSQRIDPDWRVKQVESGIFHNSLGDPGDQEAETYWRWGIALVDDAGQPVAVAGGWDDGEGMLEIGLDVHRDHRGKGLAPAVVSLMSRAIHEAGMTPTYYCAASNVRSHRTALASGFVPVLSATGLRRAP